MPERELKLSEMVPVLGKVFDSADAVCKRIASAGVSKNVNKFLFIFVIFRR